MTMLKDAEFTSVWDNGADVITTKCKFNPETGEVTDIETIDPPECLETLDEQFITVLPDGIVHAVAENEDGDFYIVKE